MPKKPKHIKNPSDPNLLARSVVEAAIGESLIPQAEQSPLSQYLAQIGRKGGLKGGPSRAKKLSAKKRQQIAKKAASARWAAKN
jgi:hypothetical protein